ncbi:MAG: peptidylprolyl isomerase [Streptosporangiaceae bacterium]
MATKKERQRQLARQAYERRQERQAQRARRTKRWGVSSVAAVLVIAVGVGIAFLLVGSSPSKPAAASAKASPSASPSPTAVPAMVNGKCVYQAAGTASRKVSLPPAKPDTGATYTATITTNRGTIHMRLLNSKAPCTVNSFVSLADQSFFNNTPCPRLTTAAYGIYVLQCGDPTGTGSGGPGYAYGSENLNGVSIWQGAGKPATCPTCAKYPAGIVAMANSGTADSNGSQFFLVYKNTPEPPNYTPFGMITSGLKVLQTIAAAGTDNSTGPGDGHPKESVQIESVTISKT